MSLKGDTVTGGEITDAKKYADFGWRTCGAAACFGWLQVTAGLLCSNAGSSGLNGAGPLI